MPRTDSAVLGGLPLTSADFCDFRTLGPRMKIDDLSAPSGRFVSRVSASVGTVDRCPGREWALLTADIAFASVFTVPTEVGAGSAEAPAAAAAVVTPTPSRSPTQGADSVETTGTTASAPASPGVPAPPTVKPSPDRISTRTRRCTATAAGTAPPAIDYGFGPVGAPRPSGRRANTPPRIPRPRPAALTAATPAPAATSVPTVPIPSDRDRADPLGTPLLRLTPPPGDTPTAPTKLDALSDAVEWQFADSVASYSHADWEQKQQAEPTCDAATRYITISGPSALPDDALSSYRSLKRPSYSDIFDLAGKGPIHTTDDDIVPLVRNPTPPLTTSAESSWVVHAASVSYTHLTLPTKA